MLTYTAGGAGPTVILLHGFPLSRAIWDSQVRGLQGSFRVVTPDLPGLGLSPALPDGGEPSMTAMAREVLALMDRLGVQKAAVAGHSMGGYVALALWKLAPERVSGLAMVASQAHPDSPEAAQGRHATAERVMKDGSGVVAAAMGPRLFAPGMGPENPLYQAATSIMAQSDPAAVRYCLLAMASREDFRQHMTQVSVPTLILTGELDVIIPADRGQTMVDAVPGAELVTLSGTGHMPMLENPDGTTRALAAWLGRISG